MSLLGVTGRRRPTVGFAVSLVLALLVGASVSAPAEARHHRYHRVAYHHRVVFHQRFHHFARRHGGYSPPFSAIVVDALAGKVLYSDEAKAQRHPASLTKVMTLYLLFEQLDRGTIAMDTRIPVSAHAASMAPTKLGLPAGDTIPVADAIKAIVTQSANDMAVAVAERLGGSEENFAQMMTRKARELGMNDTQYVNASGLPDDRQITTAYDLAILARAIQERFPQYYPLFATRSFYYAGLSMHNHNHLLGRVEGLDGIKTGFTLASGFNLMTNVRRDGRQIVAVVLGGTTAAGRDRIMANMIEDHLPEASIGDHMTPVLADASPPRARPAVVADNSEPARPPVHPATLSSEVGENSARLPAGVETYASTTTPSSRRWGFASKSVEAPADQRDETPANSDAQAAAPPKTFTDRLPVRSVFGVQTTPAASTRGETPNPVVARLARPLEPSAKGDARNDDAAPKAQAARLSDDEPTASIAQHAKPSPRLGWMIQVGATQEEAQATTLIERAKTTGRSVLSKAEPFTEKVTKDGATLFRARFAGFDEDAAQMACKVLKRSGFACFATRS